MTFPPHFVFFLKEDSCSFSSLIFHIFPSNLLNNNALGLVFYFFLFLEKYLPLFQVFAAYITLLNINEYFWTLIHTFYDFTHLHYMWLFHLNGVDKVCFLIVFLNIQCIL